MAGLWFEEFTDGMVFNHEWSRTITETDNVWFSLLTMNVQPLHIDAHYAAKTEWGKPLVNSLFTLGLMIGMSVNDTTFGKAAIHPAQIAIINQRFTPTDAERHWAERVLAAFNASATGVVQIDGVMLDAPHRAQARRIMTSFERG
jgi:MaoC like domain/C-C_Bond_Lyase of the TIM-Barrel fold